MYALCSGDNDEEGRLCDTDPETLQRIPSQWGGKTIVGHWTAQLANLLNLQIRKEVVKATDTFTVSSFNRVC